MLQYINHEIDNSHFCSTDQRSVKLMRYPFVRRPAIRQSGRLSVCVSVNNILFLYLLCN